MRDLLDLETACRAGQVERVGRLLDQGVRPEKWCLLAAIESGDPATASLTLDQVRPDESAVLAALRLPGGSLGDRILNMVLDGDPPTLSGETTRAAIRRRDLGRLRAVLDAGAPLVPYAADDAARAGWLEGLGELAERGYKLGSREFVAAVYADAVGSIGYLLERGAGSIERWPCGGTALIEATLYQLELELAYARVGSLHRQYLVAVRAMARATAKSYDDVVGRLLTIEDLRDAWSIAT